MTSDPFVGRWFHRLVVEDDGEPGYGWQGQVLAGDGTTYMLQLYSWLDGDPSRQRTARREDMEGSDWEYFSTMLDMVIGRGCRETDASGTECRARPTHRTSLGNLVCEKHADHYALTSPILVE